ncbi:hypothetical protein C4587_00815 [Candidatus Parcubacteria bacterium]|nr:MAG: hypothetical protein C4587_00815 [Candidatus Parcubacteria bacterium]
MAIEIETGIPVPSLRGRQAPQYPFSQLEIGQSFFVTGIKPGTLRARASVYAKENGAGKKFKVSAAEKDGIAGLRVWRIA